MNSSLWAGWLIVLLCLPVHTVLGEEAPNNRTSGVLGSAGRDPRSFSILDFAPSGESVDQSGVRDTAQALGAAIRAANGFTLYSPAHPAEPACVFIPAGVYRVSAALPEFVGAGCLIGEGSAQSVIIIDPKMSGDVFVWSEAWSAYRTSGATVRGIQIKGVPPALGRQNALMFYDRNDSVTLEDVLITDVPGRAIGTGILKPKGSAGQAYIRESHFRDVWIWRCGASHVPAFEFATQGTGTEDGTNEISLARIDIYGSRGPSLVVRNNSAHGVIRDLKFESLRIEGLEAGTYDGDLLDIGDPQMAGLIGNLTFTNLELIDPYIGQSAVRIASSAAAGSGPARIFIQGFIGGGIPKGFGLRIDNGSSIRAVLSEIRSSGTNVTIGPKVSDIVLDGGGAERSWTYQIDPSSAGAVLTPAWVRGNPAMLNSAKSSNR
jgi:hypothetical protein